MKKILIKSIERETNIVYTYLLSRRDAMKIIDSQHREDEYIPIKEGQFSFRNDDQIMIKTIGAGAYLQRDEVISQIKDQLFKYK